MPESPQPSAAELRSMQKDLIDWDHASFDLLRDYCNMGHERLLNAAQMDRCEDMIRMMELLLLRADRFQDVKNTAAGGFIHVMMTRYESRIRIMRKWFGEDGGWDNFDGPPMPEFPPRPSSGASPLTIASA